MLTMEILGVGAVLALAGLAGWSAHRLRTARRALREGQRLQAATARCLGDGMIATDAAGRVTLLNETAETITGWRETDARGRPGAEVFRLLRRETREPVESVIDTVLREGRKISAPDPRLLIATNGLEHLVTTTAAPIHDEAGRVAGLVLVFHDVTQRELRESALLASQEMFRLISDHVSDLISVLDLQGRRLYASRSYSRHFPKKEFYLSSFFDEVHPGDLAQARELIAVMIRTGRAHRELFRLVRPDGRLLYLEAEGSVITGPGGKPEKILVVARDITARKAAEEEIKRQLQFTETLINSMPGIFYLCDVQHKILRWNRTFETVTGHGAGEIATLDPAAYFPREDEPRMRVRMQECFERGSSQLEIHLLSKDGRKTPYFFTGLRLEVDGQPCMLGIGIDISSRIVAEEKLRSAMHRLEMQNSMLSAHARNPALRTGRLEDALSALAAHAAETLGVARTGIWFFDDTHTHLRCAHLFVRGSEANEAGPQIAAADFPDYFAALAEERAIAAGEAATDPRTHEFAAAYLPRFGITSLLDAPIRCEGRIVGVVCHEHTGPARQWQRDEENFAGSVADLVTLSLEVARRKAAQEALREAHASLEVKVAERTRELAAANERLKELDRLKSEFLATMSHELRTPLNSIIGFTGILRQGLAGPVNDEQGRQLGMVHSSARHLLGLINDLLDLSRIESGRMEMVLEAFPIAEVVREVVESLGPMAAQKNLALETALATPAPVLRSDRKKCFQILLNLVNNAVKFTPSGRVVIAVRPAGAGVEIAVTDTGIGIKPENMAQLFQAFRQVDGSARRAYEGTGLGLYLCRELATMLGGSIAVSSEFGKGSRFALTLPLEPPATPTP